MIDINLAIKQYKKLFELNQLLKNCCTLYYISSTGELYVKSIVLEKVGKLENPEELSCYLGLLINPQDLFTFTKSAKKTKLLIHESIETIKFGQSDSDEITVELHKFYGDENSFIERSLIPTMYEKFNVMDFNAEEYSFITLEDSTEIITEKELFTKTTDINNHNYVIMLTKEYFEDMKHGYDDIQIAYHSETEYKVYFILKNQTPLYCMYTIIAQFKIFG